MPEEFYLTKLIAPLISHLKETEQHSKRQLGKRNPRRNSFLPHTNPRQPANRIADTPTPPQLLQHLRNRSPSTVSIPKYQEGSVILIQRLMLCDRTDKVADVGLGGVRFCRTHVTDYLGAVEGDPVECLNNVLAMQ